MKIWNWAARAAASLKRAFLPETATPPARADRSRFRPTVPPTTQTAPVTKRGRPVSASMSRTLACLAENPAIAPPELAEKLGISRDYARTLLRRARAKAPQKTPAAPPIPVAPAPANPVLALPLQSINLNRRTQVLRMSEKGENPQSIAARLGIPTGEVEFICKVDRMLRNAF